MAGEEDAIARGDRFAGNWDSAQSAQWTLKERLDQDRHTEARTEENDGGQLEQNRGSPQRP